LKSVSVFVSLTISLTLLSLGLNAFLKALITATQFFLFKSLNALAIVKKVKGSCLSFLYLFNNLSESSLSGTGWLITLTGMLSCFS